MPEDDRPGDDHPADGRPVGEHPADENPLAAGPGSEPGPVGRPEPAAPPPDATDGEPAKEPEPRFDQSVAYDLLAMDFEQAFILHNAYKTEERELYVLSLRILAFPMLIAGALLSAELISTDNIDATLRLPIIWLGLIASGLLNFVVVRAYVVTDRVQTESKHQVNRLRSLYLLTLAKNFPDGWTPVWGATNAYLDTRIKLKAAFLTPLVLGTVNSLYVAVGLDSLLTYQAPFEHHRIIAICTGVVYLLLQLELTWNVIRRAMR